MALALKAEHFRNTQSGVPIVVKRDLVLGIADIERAFPVGVFCLFGSGEYPHFQRVLEFLVASVVVTQEPPRRRHGLRGMKIIRGTKLGAYGFKCVSPMQPAHTWRLRESRAQLTFFASPFWFTIWVVARAMSIYSCLRWNLSACDD